MEKQPVYKVTKTDTFDGMNFSVTRDGKVICSGNWFGDSDAKLIERAIAHAKKMGL